MSARRRSRQRAGRETTQPVDVVCCRGCCCGTDKHPDVDHTGQLEALQGAAHATGGRVVVSDCLGPCDRSNVVVVRPRRQARGQPARPVWLGAVLSDGVVSAIDAWVRAGGPAGPDLPEALLDHLFTPSRRDRQELEAHGGAA